MPRSRKPLKVPAASEAEAQLAIARKVAERRRDALAAMAVADRVMDEDREILRALAKGERETPE